MPVEKPCPSDRKEERRLFGYKRDKRGGGERRHSKLKENRNEGGKGCGKRGKLFQHDGKKVGFNIEFHRQASH